MNKLLTTLFALAVASVTGLASAQTAPAAPSQTPAAAPAPSAAAAPAAAPATAAQPASPKSLEAKVAMCVGCHGIVGYKASFPEVYRVPMISGQNAKYIVSALTAYKQGDRKHPTMHGIAASLSEQDMNDVANFYSTNGQVQGAALPEKAAKEPSPQVAALLQKAACVSCHGANFSKPIDPAYPRIAGQHRDYLFVALKAYKTDNNPAVGRSNAIMGGIARQFSNAELKELANYVGSLDSELKIVPEHRFRR